MSQESFANRLSKALSIRNMRPIDLANKSGINKAIISQYLSGRYKAKQDNIYLLSEALNINESWLMGFDVPMERIPDELRNTNNNVHCINTDGLDKNDVEEIDRFVEFVRNKKNSNMKGS